MSGFSDGHDTDSDTTERETADIDDRPRTVLVAGTASHVGKSTVVAGLCRHLSRNGISVAPFKAQNMSNNARVALTRDGDWGEIGVSQYVQARAAGVVPTTDMNPVLLKPRGNTESQLVVQGDAIGQYDPSSYYDDHWDHARRMAQESYERLAAEYDVIVAEGAGSIAEINLHHRDLANLETARFADASIVLLGDIERGGVFASLYGTLELVPSAIRDRIVGTVITKFRGDRSLLETGIDELERKTDVPVLGVLPHDDPGLPAEDSVSLPAESKRSVRGNDDGIAPERAVTIAVPRLPRISNFTDLEPLARLPGVRVAYVPLDSTLASADAVVLPGTKNTVDDLLALERAGLDERIAAFQGPVVGLCGGYQMLGKRLTNVGIEGTGTGDTGDENCEETDCIRGIGRLPIETRFSREKHVERVTRSVSGVGPIAGASGTATGYEIHAGRTEPVEPVASSNQPLGPSSLANETTLGTYLHGLFENDFIREAFVDVVFEDANTRRPTTTSRTRSPYRNAADLVDQIDLSLIFEDFATDKQ